MDYCKVTAIIRLEALEAVEQRLMAAGACGMTVTRVRGCGEWKDFYHRDALVTHVRIEIFTHADKAEALAGLIVEEAHTGAPGDGIVAVLPVSHLWRIRTGKAGVPTEL